MGRRAFATVVCLALLAASAAARPLGDDDFHFAHCSDAPVRSSRGQISLGAGGANPMRAGAVCGP